MDAKLTGNPGEGESGVSARRQSRILNLGSGARPLPNAVNVDLVARTGPDVLHDLNVHPWPFDDSEFDEVVGYDVLEHIADTVGFMQEVHRVARAGALVRLTVPHFSSGNAWRDPTHVRAFTHDSLDYFTPTHALRFYSQASFARRSARIIFRPSLANRLIGRLANRWPQIYEDRWAWIFPAWFIYFELCVLKDPSREDSPRRG